MRNLKHVYLCVLNLCFCDVMDMGKSLHYDDLCVLKKVFGPNFGVKNKVRHKPSGVGNYYHGHSFSSL